MEEKLTPLEKKILDEIVRPALTDRYESHLYGNFTLAQDLRVDVLLGRLKSFYEKHDGPGWNQLLANADNAPQFAPKKKERPYGF